MKRLTMQPTPSDSEKERRLPAVQQGRLADHVTARLRHAILRGRFVPGERLREIALASMLKVSRGPVREALAELEHEGVVITQPNRGASVARLSDKDEEEVRSLRLALERLAIQLAVHYATEGHLKALDRCVVSLERALRQDISPREIVEFEIAFHDLVYKMTKHERLQRCWASIRSQVHIFLLSRNVDHPQIRRVLIRRHRAIVSALRARDELAAVAIIDEHLRGISD